MKRLLLCLLLTGCRATQTKPAVHSTAALEHNISSVRSSISEADASALRAQGHLNTARAYLDKADYKNSIVLEYLEGLKK